MATVFSHPSFPTSDSYSVVGYNLIVSRAKGNTLSASPVSSGTHTVTPASMANIKNGSLLTINAGATDMEIVSASNVSGSTFDATFAQAHTGPFYIQSDSLAPNHFGPWLPLQTNYVNNLAIVDMGGSAQDLYRVQPILQANVDTTSPGPMITLDYSRAFHSSTPLYDAGVSALIDNLRTNFLKDNAIKSTDSTIITESTGQGVMPFITDAATSRFYLSFLPNADPVKFRDTDCLVFAGANSAAAVAMSPYKDFYANGQGGYIDFASIPSANSYLKVEYNSFNYTDDECRSMLTNAVSELSLYGITNQNYGLTSSFNYLALNKPLPDRDVAQIVCAIARKNALGAEIHSTFKSSESWKNNGIEYTADPSRSIQAGTGWQDVLNRQIHEMANNYIINTRQYFSRGEYDSFFDNSGLFYPPFSIYNVFNYMSWWL